MPGRVLRLYPPRLGHLLAEAWNFLAVPLGYFTGILRLSPAMLVGGASALFPMILAVGWR